MTSKTFFVTLDGMRGTAALLIVARHAQFIFQPFVFDESYLAVDLFFVLSGVVICQAYNEKICDHRSSLDFIVSRVSRIYPFYLLGTVIGIADFFLTRQGYASGKYGGGQAIYLVAFGLLMLPNAFAELALFPLNSPAWSLFYEMIANIIYAYVRLISQKIFKYISIVCVVVIGTWIYLDPSQNISAGDSAQQAIAGFARVGYSFFAGVLIYRLYRGRSQRSLPAGVATTLSWLAVGTVVLDLTYKPSAAFRPYYDFCSVAVLFPSIVYVTLFIQPGRFTAGIFKFGGYVSYPMYALHAPLVTLVYGAAETLLHISGEQWAPWSGFVFVVFLVLLCILLEKYYERPTRKLLKVLWTRIAQPSNRNQREPKVNTVVEVE